MTTINTIDDLARILREQPAWGDTLRALLLTEDLLDLPARLDRFIQSQEETNRRLEEAIQRQEEANKRQEETNRRLEEAGQRQEEAGQRQEETNRRLEEAAQRQEETIRRLEEAAQRQEEASQRQEEINRLIFETLDRMQAELSETSQRVTNLEGRFNRLEGRFSNFEGAQYEGMVRTKALARAHLQLGFESPHVVLHQEGLTDSRLTSAITRALRERLITGEDYTGIFEADLIISDEGNRHAVFEVSLTADVSDILRAKQRAEILETITGGTVNPVVIAARVDDARYAEAEAEEVMIFVIPYP